MAADVRRRTRRPEGLGSGDRYELDEHIAAGLRSRDEGALREAISCYGAAVFGMASRICRGPALAEEAAQDAFLALWRRPSLYDSARGGMKSLVVSIARNKAVDLVRREESARRVTKRLEKAVERTEEDGPSVGVDLRDEMKWALAKLTPLQRDAISLAYFGGKSYREVADQLGIAEGTAKTRIRDGLAALRQLLLLERADRDIACLPRREQSKPFHRGGAKRLQDGQDDLPRTTTRTGTFEARRLARPRDTRHSS